MNFSLKQVCYTAVLTAVTFVVTRFIQIPIPLGYFNVGNCIILLSCVLLPSPSGLIIGSLGSALADLTSYPAYTLPTLIIKFLMPLVFYLIIKQKNTRVLRQILAAAVSTLIPLVGYTLTGSFLYGGIAAGLAQVPGLALEYIANLGIFAALCKQFIKLRRYVNI